MRVRVRVRVRVRGVALGLFSVHRMLLEHAHERARQGPVEHRLNLVGLVLGLVLVLGFRGRVRVRLRVQ